MNKHTSGPWTWRAADRGYQDHETSVWEDPPSPAAVIVGSDDDLPEEHNTIAWMNNCIPEETQEANARLIAAAPDLLAACEEALEVFGGNSVVHHNAIAMLRKAITRVRRAT